MKNWVYFFILYSCFVFSEEIPSNFYDYIYEECNETRYSCYMQLEEKWVMHKDSLERIILTRLESKEQIKIIEKMKTSINLWNKNYKNKTFIFEELLIISRTANQSHFNVLFERLKLLRVRVNELERILIILEEWDKIEKAFENLQD